MLRTIIVPLDGSSLAVRALPFAARIARASGAALMLLHASSDVSPVSFPHPTSMELASVRRRLDASEMLADLETLAEQLRTEGILASSVLEAGEPVHVILETLTTRRADLVVMSTLGRGGLGRWVYGSVADAVLREVAIPVLLIPVASDRTWPEDQRLGLLIALDGSAFSEEVLEPASELGRWLDADIHLVSAVEPTGARAAWTALADAEEYLQRIAQRLRAAGRMVQVHAVAGAPATAIATVAQQEQVDLIAMATHGRGGLSRLVMGSVAATILQQADLPVLVVRPTAVRHAARPVSGGARLIAEADRSTTLVALTPAEKDFLRHALHGLEQTTEPRSRTAVIVRDLLVKFERAEMLDDEPARPAAPDATMQWEQVDQPECDNRQHGKPERR